MCAILPSLSVVLIAGDEYSESLIVISSTILAIQLPYALIPLIKFTSSPNIMGPMTIPDKHLKYTQPLAAFIICANVVLVIITVAESGLITGSFVGVFLALCVTMLIIVYVGSLLYLARRPVHQNLLSRTGRRMTRDVDVGAETSEWTNDGDLLPDPGAPAVYSL